MLGEGKFAEKHDAEPERASATPHEGDASLNFAVRPLRQPARMTS